MSVNNHLSRISPEFRQEQDYHRILFEHSPIGVALCRMNGELVEVNPAFAKIIGRTVEETLQLSYWDVTPKVYINAEQQQLQILDAAGHYGPYEKHYIHKSGQLVPVRLSGKIIMLDGESYIWSCVEDISDRQPKNESSLIEILRDLEYQLDLRTAQLMEETNAKQHSEQLSRLNEAKYRAILDSAVDGIITINEHGIIDSFNPSAEQLFGYTAAEVLGKNISILMPEPYASAHNRYLQHYLTSHQAKIIGIGREVQGLRKDGSVFPMYLAVSDVAVAGQRLFTGIVRDITQLKHAQALLLKSEERFRRSQRFANIGTWDWNVQTGELYWSERIATLFGYQEGEIDTTYENFLKAVHPDDRQRVIDAVNNCVAHGTEYNIEHRCLWPNGEVRWLLERGDVIRDKHGTPLHMLGVVQDITTRKQAEIDLQAAKDEAERANCAKSEFLSSMSHELRTPLNAVLGFAQLLEFDDGLTAIQQESVAEIQRAGNHLLELINEVLDLAKIESGHVTLSLEPVSLSKIINECCTLTQTIADQKGVKVGCSRYLGANGGTCSGLGCAGKRRAGEVCVELNCADQNYVMADYTRLKQVFLNLLSNAVKYNRNNGSVTLRIFETAGNMIRIEVKDTGYGIPKEKFAQLFQPFSRLGAESGNVEGTGIGLVITKQFVKMMSGNIGVNSEPGIGSTFWIELPRADHKPTYDQERLAKQGNVKHPSESMASSAAQTAGQSPATKEDRDNMRLLVVEDNYTNQIIMENQLKVLGYQADIASNGARGLELFNSNRYLAVLTDINLPDIDGYELTGLIRSHEKAADTRTPIIAVTANALRGEAEKCLARGMDGYISKPVDLHKLSRILKQHIPNAALSNTARPAPVDIQVLHKMLGDDSSIHQRVLQTFTENSPQIINEMQKAYTNHSAGDIIWCTHKLKSSSHAIGAKQLAASCEALESAARDENWQNVARIYNEVDRLFASVQDFIRHYNPATKDSTS